MPTVKSILGMSGVLVALTPFAVSAQALPRHHGGPGGKRFAPPAVMGTVSAVSGSSITVAGKNGTTYTVDGGTAQITKIVSGARTTIAVGDVQSGDTLTVFGTVSGTSVTAQRIIDGTVWTHNEKRGGNGRIGTMMPPVAFGSVSSVNGTSITVAGKNGSTSVVDASASTIVKFTGKTPTTIPVSAIQTGDTIVVFGTVSASGAITATKIIDGMPSGKFGQGYMPANPPRGKHFGRGKPKSKDGAK